MSKNTWDSFYGPNEAYALELYERYRQDPNAVDAATRDYFERHGPPPDAGGASSNGAIITATATLPTTATPAVPPSAPAPYFHQPPTSASGGAVPVGPAAEISSPAGVVTIVLAARLARSIREYGHLAASVDPLGSLPPGDPMLDPATHGITEAELAALPASIVWPNAGPDYGSCLDALRALRAIYCGEIGYEFDHVQDFTERAWLHEAVESGRYREPLSAEAQRELLQRLSEVEGFERFLHTTFPGQKRFSLEGLDMLIPMLDALISDAAEAGAREVLIGMAHRGRLNVLAHVLGKPYATIFSEFHAAPNKELTPSEGSMGINFGWTGDVKYHLGARLALRESEQAALQLTMAHNPSHLEFVNPVIEGYARSAQENRELPGYPSQSVDVALPILIHGDAAFPGEGIVAETLNLSRLEGYTTGGTVHLIANNQIGFTTGPRQARSTLYAADLAKGYEIPIVHVNADAPEACLAVIRLAHAYRQRFHKDFLIDLVGYRRHGHNEGDEPAYTQPQLYASIAGHPSVRTRYAEQLERGGVVTPEQAHAMTALVERQLRAAYDEMHAGHVASEPGELHDSPPLASFATGVPEQELRALNDALLERPEGFAPNAKLERLLQRRREHLEKPGGIDWGHAETLAFASILAADAPIRMTGQDSERGTFSQRHLVLHDNGTGAILTPLQRIPQARASFAVYNSPLSEAAVIGFEYGYSVHAPGTLVLWEAQFGDFANAGQVLIDQFIVAARAKWRQLPSLVLLLPHGYEGQGPEHSSGRIERYLQLAAEDNVRVANPTTAAQYFHLLRAQAASLRAGDDARRPLVVMTPKSLLRNPRAAASLAQLATGSFQPVLDDVEVRQPEEVQRIVLCSGKIAVDLVTARADLEGRSQNALTDAASVAIVRLEQLYPYPADALRTVFRRYPNAREIVWVQEEPRNMGAAYFVEPRVLPLLPKGVTLGYIGRPERAATAEGYPEVHAAEQARIMNAALTPGGPVSSTLSPTLNPSYSARPSARQDETRGTADVR
ncbi:MAG TPA: 2-oxoglutarate dehydrogenase E1 component [Ktedonobacterales bacterium]